MLVNSITFSTAPFFIAFFMVSKAMWNYILNTCLCEYWIILVLLDCVSKLFLKVGNHFEWKNVMYFFCKVYINHFLQFFGMIYVTLFCYLMWHCFFIFAIVVKYSSTITVDMRAFSAVPETYKSTVNSLSNYFELSPKFILHSCSFTRSVTLFNSHCLQLLIRVP